MAENAQPDRMAQSGPESVEATTKPREQGTFENMLGKTLEDASAPAVRDSPRPDCYLMWPTSSNTGCEVSTRFMRLRSLVDQKPDRS